jgi:hypothetical protein
MTDSTRIPTSIETGTKLLGAYTLSDAAVALTPAVCLVLVVQVTVPPGATLAGVPAATLVVPLAGAGIAVGAAIVAATPAHTTSINWLARYLGFRWRDRRLGHDAAAGQTRVARVHPSLEALERTDGALVALVAVDPPSVALATSEEWEQNAASFREFLDTVVEFPVQFYATTRDIDTGEYLSPYRERRASVDAADRPAFADLIESYLDWYETRVTENRITVRDHYVVVPVCPREVSVAGGGHLAALDGAPLVGTVLDAVRNRPVERRTAIADTLDERVGEIVAGLRDVAGCDARRFSAEQAAVVLGDYWGTDLEEYGDIDTALGTAAPPTGGTRT